jgi:hypothetical protein
MDRTKDLELALSFVLGRIAEQAKLSGQPLSDEQLLLLKFLPSSMPQNWSLEMPVLVPRDINLERVCALGKAAYDYDRQVNSASRDWEFAFAVFTLNQHSMRGLLQSAGMKPHRPSWDGFLLIVTALVPVVAVLLVVWRSDGSLFRSVGIVSGCVAIMVSLFFASRRTEKRRLAEDIERCRVGVDSSLWSGRLPESDKLAWLPEHRLVSDVHRGLSFATRSVVCHWI